MEPTFIRQALAKLTAEQAKTGTQMRTGVTSVSSKAEFWSFVAAFAVPLVWGTLAYLLQSSVIDRAAALQKRAEPGDIVVGGEVAAAALVELNRIAPLPEAIQGEAAFSWHMGQRT